MMLVAHMRLVVGGLAAQRLSVCSSLAGLLLLLFVPDLIAAQGRYALVVGNSKYEALAALPNAVGDSQAVAEELRRAGFEVTVRADLRRFQILEEVVGLARRAEGGGEVVFFYAGHGIQVNNTNFLIPVDFHSNDPALVEYGAVNLFEVSNRLSEAKARFSLLVIDACRNNPLPRPTGRTAGTQAGLAPMSPVTGQMIVYSAGTGQAALDGLGDRDPIRTSVFVREFVKRMRTPGLSVREAMEEVRDAVEKLASSIGHAQRPAVYDESRGRFYFYPPVAPAPTSTSISAATLPLPAGGATQTSARGKSAEEIEDELWVSILTSTDSRDFAGYLKVYPVGRYAARAQFQIERLARNAVVTDGAGQAAAAPLLTAPPKTAPSISAPSITAPIAVTPAKTLTAPSDATIPLADGRVRFAVGGWIKLSTRSDSASFSTTYGHGGLINPSFMSSVNTEVVTFRMAQSAANVAFLAIVLPQSTDRISAAVQWTTGACDPAAQKYVEKITDYALRPHCRYIRSIKWVNRSSLFRSVANPIQDESAIFFEISYAYYDYGRLLEVAVIADSTLIKDVEAAKRWARALSTALIPVATGKESVLTIPPFKFP